jgi:hypothetical protein
MDVSKLPRLSKSDPPPDNGTPPGEVPPAQQAERLDYARPLAPDVGFAGTIWISLIVGLLLLYMGQNFAKWGIATLRGGTYRTNVEWTAGQKAGQPVAYWELQGFTALSDAAVFLFGLAMVLEAVALLYVHSRLRGKAGVLTVALVIAVLATVFNLYVAARLFAFGLPLLPILAVAFGGYIVMYQWKLLQLLRTGQSAPMT